jgi:predicted ATPase/DNA-binding SARP family transcriptional activator/DNA-binding CsgD family transcriptional regulator
VVQPAAAYTRGDQFSLDADIGRERMSRRPQHHQHRSSTTASSKSREPEAIRIKLLGGFRVWVGPRVIEENQWRLKKARSLIKLLALSAGHRLHREQAMELLWPGLEPHAAANNLHYALHVARHALEPSTLASSTSVGAAVSSSGYLHLGDEQLTLCPDVPMWVDVEAFEEAAATARQARVEPAAFRAATDLYAGELLPEDRYEPWVEERRQQLKELYHSLLLDLAALYEEREEFGEAIEVLGRVVAQEPTHEGAHFTLMRLYALSGRRREALSQYERLREILNREFGTEPEAATTRLQQEIWAGTFPHPDSPPTDSPAEEVRSAAGAPRGHNNNLPLARTSFVGRERERLVVKRLLAMTKLLTLTGAGGCGKTRLALEVARDLLGAYPDGVWLVELAPLSDPSLVEQAVASTLGVREQPGRPLLETLKDTLRPRKTLLVVDNCEHLVEEVARLVDALLDSCPNLRILATGRERLNTSGEVTRVVPSLTVPEARRPSTPPGLEAYESVRLFVERARQVDPSFVLSAANAEAVSQVCQQLEGIPLAIELAAARMGMLSAGQLSERLEDSLKVLTRGERTAEPRHQSLRVTLEWSHELLSEAERVLFRRLSVFAGGWTLEAAEEVCSGEDIEQDDVLDVLSELVERSLVVTEAGQEEVPHFRMLEPIRQYGQERLEESGESEALRSRHAGYYLALAEGEDPEEADPGVRRSRPVAWLRRMEAEHANLRAALSWSLDEDAEESDGRRVELGLRLTTALFYLWLTHDYLSEGRGYLERALVPGRRITTTDRLRARALDGAGWLAGIQGDIGAATALMEEALALYRQLGDEEGIASALTNLGMAAVLGQRDDIPLPAVMEELGELKPRLENRMTLAYLLMLEGLIALSRGDLEQSVALHEEGLELFREIRDTRGILHCLLNLGLLALIQGDYEGALPLLRETLRLGWNSDYTETIQYSLHGLACVAASREQPVRAARLWGTVEGMQEAYGVHITAITHAVTNYEGRLAAARSQLDEEVWSAAWAQGKAMPLEQAVEYALSEEQGEHEPPTLAAVPDQPPPATDEPTGTLTPREQEIALLVARGLTNRQIAKELSISERTAANHVAKILKKFGLHSRAQIATWATQRRLVPSEPSY